MWPCDVSALQEEHRLRAFEKRVRRRIFGRKRDEVRENSEKIKQ
jgi:hypothetical protein